MKKISKFLLTFGSITSVISSPLILLACGNTQEDKKSKGTQEQTPPETTKPSESTNDNQEEKEKDQLPDGTSPTAPQKTPEDKKQEEDNLTHKQEEIAEKIKNKKIFTGKLVQKTIDDIKKILSEENITGEKYFGKIKPGKKSKKYVLKFGTKRSDKEFKNLTFDNEFIELLKNNEIVSTNNKNDYLSFLKKEDGTIVIPFKFKNKDTIYEIILFSLEKKDQNEFEPTNPNINENKDKQDDPTSKNNVPNDSQQNPNKQPQSNLKEHKIKWGHWNIRQFNGESKTQDKKTKRIAILANKQKFDVLGLTEVYEGDGVKKIVDEINKLNGSNIYSYIVSKKLKGDIFGNAQAEHVAVIYNTQKLETEAFSNGQIGYSYTNKFTDIFGNENSQYSRPPYGVKFKYKIKPEYKMTFVFSHFDSPGTRTETNYGNFLDRKSISGIGAFEYRESQQLVNVLDYFDSIDGQQSNVFFGGDTNIKIGKEEIAFSTLKGKYKSALKDSEEYKTSLGNSNNWSEPYDKLFYKIDSNWKLSNSYKYDIFKVNNPDEEIYKILKDNNLEIKPNEKIANATTLSDHTSVGAEIIME
ncbi:endonuclease/exonuclease/phosphatase family protein [Metamycoplasma canadense]|uniref:Membrane nuclease A n=1 Tax=Metamycoplasma canadense TaxID=29554 RepID=A0A077L513_9BACT|nr:endonuclease/exonuclease/phosphatase family protein [Metamycoplasma canadense]BAP39380.1 membrane nuclease A [Metamycoplasma canadense]